MTPPKIHISLRLLLFFLSLSTFGLEGKVIFVDDGDSMIIIDSKKKKYKVRLKGIDAPEFKQSYGQKAKKALAAKILNKKVTIEGEEKDKYDRIIAIVYNRSGLNINLYMISTGNAWHYKHFSKDKEFAKAERLAKKRKIGLWKSSKPTPPWEWRQKHKK